MARQKTPDRKLHTATMVDNFAKVSQDLAAAAIEQTEADLALVVATGRLSEAAREHERAITRKTKAEGRLAKLRADLGINV
jgi:uncharacterized protein YgbK (DUF1537 family)